LILKTGELSCLESILIQEIEIMNLKIVYRNRSSTQLSHVHLCRPTHPPEQSSSTHPIKPKKIHPLYSQSTYLAYFIRWTKDISLIKEKKHCWKNSAFCQSEYGIKSRLLVCLCINLFRWIFFSSFCILQVAALFNMKSYV
jgi:hypothetical protein